MSAVNTQFSVGVHVMQVLEVYSDQKIVSSFIAGSVNADPGLVRFTLSKLVKAGLVHSTRGRYGSCELSRPATQISLLEIYRAIEAPGVFATHNYPVDKKCVVSVHHKETMEQVFMDCQEAFELSLQKTMLADVVKPIKKERRSGTKTRATRNVRTGRVVHSRSLKA